MFRPHFCRPHYVNPPLSHSCKAGVFLLLCLLTSFGASLQAQSKAVQEAASLAENRQYSEAVRLLELAMIEGDTSEALIFDLADYYKKTGNLRMATALCKPLVDKDRPRPWHLLEVATMLIDQGRYTEAEPYLKRFEEMKPEDARASALRAYALRRQSLGQRYPHARLDTFIYNTPADEGFPFVHGSTFYWSSDRSGSKRQSGWTGRPMIGLYESQIQEDGSLGGFQRLDARFNRGVFNTASPWLSKSGDTLFFSANAETVNRMGDHNMQLFMAIRRPDGQWYQAERLEAQFDQFNCMHPSLSPDGRKLFFASDAPDGRGGLDIYSISIGLDGSWGRPENLGPSINTERHDAFPSLSSSGRLYFASQGHISLGGFDIFESSFGSDGKWSTAVNLGEPINSEADETGWLQVGSNKAWLVSDRLGEDDDIFKVEW